MTDSPTPRTDAATIEFSLEVHPLFKSITYVTVDFAKQLERELSEAKIDCNQGADFTEQLKDALRRVMNTTPSCLADWKTDMRRQFVWLREKEKG